MRPWLQDPDGDGTWTWSTTRDPGRVVRDQGDARPVVGRELRRRRRARTARTSPTSSRPGSAGDVQLRAGDARADGDDIARRSSARPRHSKGALARARPPRLGPARPRRAAGASGCTPPRPVGWPSTRKRSSVATSFPLTLDPDGLPATSASSGRTWPRTTRSGCRATTPAMLTSCSPVSSRSRPTTTSDALSTPPACRSRASSTTSTTTPTDRDLGVTWHGRTPKLAVWAPTAKDVDLLVRGAGATTDTLVEMRRDDDGVWSVTGRR